MVIRQLHVFLVKYFARLTVAFHDLPALFGFFLLLVILNQILSGIVLSMSLIPESMYIPLAREEEDSENLYTDDFFWMHERGVDLTVLLLFAHIFRKLYVGSNNFEQEFAWKSGASLFLLMQVVIFLGLVLCCTHLSDITLTIAVNAFNTACFFVGKLYWIVFPDQTLNTDTIVRLAYAHYILALYVCYLSVYHGIDMHYDWKSDAMFTGMSEELNWYDEVLLNELGQFLIAILLFTIVCLMLYSEPEALNYELFMWGDVGMVTDIRFFGVAPHWYFRPYMGWLVACPFHYTGLLGLVLFFTIFYFQPNILTGANFFTYTSLKSLIWETLKLWQVLLNKLNLSKKDKITYDIVATKSIDTLSIFFKSTFALILISTWYTFSYLPYGRFFNRLGGNGASLLAYSYLFIYFGTPYLRISSFYSLNKTINNCDQLDV